jgi:phage I-like protein
MAKQAAAKTKTAKVTQAKAKKTKGKLITAKLTYTAEMEAQAIIKILPGHTPDEVLEAIRSEKAGFFHEIGEIEVDGVVIATLARPHLLNDEYDDFEIEPL